MRLEKRNYLFGEMMRVHDGLADTGFAQTQKSNFQQRAPIQFDQRLRTIIGQRAQPRAQSCRQHHSLHLPIFSSSVCRKATSTPFIARKCLANCSAKNTERCCPPVHPNDTIKFLKPRLR